MRVLGRPSKSSGPLRNFTFRDDLDEFLIKEAGNKKSAKPRTPLGMTRYLEAALDYFRSLKPKERDVLMKGRP